MNKIIKQVIELNKNKKEEAFVYIVKHFENLLCSRINRVDELYREDLTQELVFGLFILIKKFVIRNYEIDDSIFTRENLLELQKHKFQNINTVFKLDYISLFMEKYGSKIFIEAFDNFNYRKKLIEEYSLFCNENQFISKVRKAFDFITNRFCKLIELDKEHCIEKREDYDSMINQIVDKSTIENKKSIYNLELSENDLCFLLDCIDEKNLNFLSQKKVAEKRKVTQQAVSKRIKRIQQKLRVSKGG